MGWFTRFNKSNKLKHIDKSVFDIDARINSEKATEAANAMMKRAYDDNLISAAHKAEYIATLEEFDKTQNISLFDYKIEGFNSWEVKANIYEDGALMWLVDLFGNVVYVPFVVTRWKYNNQPLACRPVPKRDSPNIDKTKEYFVGIDCIIQYDTNPFWDSDKPRGRREMVKVFLEQMAEVFVRLNINIMLSGDKLIVIHENTETAAEIQAMLSYVFSSHSPFAVLNKPLIGDPATHSFDPKFEELAGLLMKYDAFRQNIHGFGSGNYSNDKKERLIVDEQAENAQSVDFAFKTRENCLLDFIEQAEKASWFNNKIEYVTKEEQQQEQKEEQKELAKAQGNDNKGEKDNA